MGKGKWNAYSLEAAKKSMCEAVPVISPGTQHLILTLHAPYVDDEVEMMIKAFTNLGGKLNCHN